MQSGEKLNETGKSISEAVNGIFVLAVIGILIYFVGF
jgi:hypothetical protein